MHRLNLDQANALIEATFAKGVELGLKPLTAAVLDPGGYLIAAQRQDTCSNIRVKLAQGKAAGALALGVPSRVIAKMAEERPHFIASISGMGEGGMVPAGGGVIIADPDGTIVGAIGVTGDTSENDEACAFAAIESLGLKAKD